MSEAKSQTQLPEQIYYYHNDHLGTPKVVTNQAGSVVWDVDYSPFGEISSYLINSLSVDQPFRFPGQYQDSLTGLYYNWNRYYMPEVGRYNRIDIAGQSNCSTYIFNNPYFYARNNSIVITDPKGLFVVSNCGDKTGAVSSGGDSIGGMLGDSCFCKDKLNPDDKKRLLNTLNSSQTNIECTNTETFKDNSCAGASGTHLYLSNCAIRGGLCQGGGQDCGCLNKNIFHELLHSLTRDDSRINDIEKCIKCP